MTDKSRVQFGECLLILARDAIGRKFHIPERSFPDLPALQAPGATFVTLIQRRNLRGCIGSLSAYRPLIEDVRQNACAAAFSDPRFPPVTVRELAGLHVEVSLLSPPTPLSFKDEADALAKIRPEIDGIILQVRQHRATFLPQVWEQLPDPKTFMAHLKEKAGLPSNYWSSDIVLECYQVEKWKEAEN